VTKLHKIWCKIYSEFHRVSWISSLHSPSFTDISPIAQVALLHTDINSGFKFCPRIGRKSAANKTNNTCNNNYCPSILLKQLYSGNFSFEPSQCTIRLTQGSSATSKSFLARKLSAYTNLMAEV